MTTGPAALPAAVRRAFFDALEGGATVRDALDASGIPESTYYAWKAAGEREKLGNPYAKWNADVRRAWGKARIARLSILANLDAWPDERVAAQNLRFVAGLHEHHATKAENEREEREQRLRKLRAEADIAEARRDALLREMKQGWPAVPPVAIDADEGLTPADLVQHELRELAQLEQARGVAASPEQQNRLTRQIAGVRRHLLRLVLQGDVGRPNRTVEIPDDLMASILGARPDYEHDITADTSEQYGRGDE